MVGLGNPGPNYLETRHNLGAKFIENLCVNHGINLNYEQKFKGQIGKLNWKNQSITCLIPMTYMNLSGQSVYAYADYFQISPQQILIIHDEVLMPPGTCRLKMGGGHGGHNGLKNIIQSLGSADFNRLRIGIGQAPSRAGLSDYVLAKPNLKDSPLIAWSIEQGIKRLPQLIEGPWDLLIQELNQLKA